MEIPRQLQLDVVKGDEKYRKLQANDDCVDPEWCHVPMPGFSYFKFDPPKDPSRWRKAQIQAANGEQVLLQEILKVFPNHLDFIDGDISFRKLHMTMDFFVDESRDLTPLTTSRKKRDWIPAEADSYSKQHRRSTLATIEQTNDLETDNEQQEFDSLTFPPNVESNTPRRLLGTSITAPTKVNGRVVYPWEVQGMQVIPDPYDFRKARRAPVVGIGYTAYERDSEAYFSGNRVGGAFIDRNTFFRHWRQSLQRLDTPFIGICALNENWGFISTNFPNRTAGWGRCCDSPHDTIVYDFLNHPKTLMLVSNQHTNVSHPKLLILPRGIPITWGWTRVIMWDTMRNLVKDGVKKDMLLFATGSKWGPRPQILRCISQKFAVTEFSGHVKRGVQPHFDRDEYYSHLGRARFGLGLPGLGYDCFRNWELMTMGAIVVLEKGVGLDRTMWRLPALLVEDFAVLTPQMLRQAYVEALYRAKDFEFHRLTQSFWTSVIANVSASMSSQPLIDLFPMRAEDSSFTRPRVPFDCWRKPNGCGPGTKRIPQVSC
jgi:hypothetical protein